VSQVIHSREGHPCDENQCTAAGRKRKEKAVLHMGDGNVAQRRWGTWQKGSAIVAGQAAEGQPAIAKGLVVRVVKVRRSIVVKRAIQVRIRARL
jgi:hypothetical protein